MGRVGGGGGGDGTTKNFGPISIIIPVTNGFGNNVVLKTFT